MWTMRVFWPAAGCLILVAGILEVTSALGETQTWDEGIHMVSGYTYLRLGDYSWNPEHPPLAKIMSALPLAVLHPDLPTSGEGWGRHDQTRFGIDFLYRNRLPADTILFAARAMTMLLSLLFLTALAWWTRRHSGGAAALLATALCAFDPNLIAHARYVTTDFPVTVFYFFAGVLFTDYLESGRARDLAIAATAFALALVTKFSALLLIPTLAALYGIRWLQKPSEFPLRRAAQAAGALITAALAAIGIVYWPETLHEPAHRFFSGLNAVITHNAGGHASYLLGLRSDTGWWYYFPVVFAVKGTMAALAATAALVGVGAWLCAMRRSGRALDRFRAIPIIWIGLLAAPLIYFGVSMSSGIDIGMRHLLPIYPFLYVATAAFFADLRWRRVAWFVMLALGALQLAECASITPHYLAFFNAFAGGPGRGPDYLVDSNIDWGQDVKKLVKWLDAHGTRRAWCFYFGNAQLRYYGVDDQGMPAAMDQAGWEGIDGFAVANVTPLQGVYVPLADLAPLRWREPMAKIGWSMYVYDLRKSRR